jgi:arylsulfatase A-like enzyme
VFIFMDDLGWKDVGYNGCKFYETPNIDRLARQGMVFHQAYVNAGNCAPSRACLISGQYTPRHKVYAVGSIRRGRDALKRLDVASIAEARALPAGEVTMAGALKAAGYATCFIGKWHLGKSGEDLPGAHGFDKVVTHANAKRAGAGNDPKGIYAFTAAANRFMEDNRGRPFFIYLAHHAIHSPIQARPEAVRKFEAKQVDDAHGNAKYAACIHHSDDGVGQLLARLKELGLEENTIVVFFSDNGPTGASSAAPLRGHKGMYYEGGIREPLVVRWPAVIKAGSTCNEPVVAIDFFPTFLAAAGAARPAGKVLDGASLLPLFRGAATLKREAIFWHFPGYLDRAWPGTRDPRWRTPPVSVIRKGDWKLHLFHEEWSLDGGWDARDTNNAVELYNLADDIGELKDLANVNKAKRDELLKDLLAWWKSVDAPIATKKNASYDPAAKPQPGRGRRRGKRKKKGE